jgi:long-subunit acyl-CoA synthetase (AMP-forming)
MGVSGGAAIPPAVDRTFWAWGCPSLQGYGMTETSPVVAVNSLEDNDPATVGRPLPGLEVRLGKSQELEVRGPSVMQGYWNRDEDTARVLGADGWLRTGDQAELRDGRIFIRGRLKEIIVTSTGEKVPPEDLERALCEDSLIDQAFVVGEHKPFIGVVVVLTPRSGGSCLQPGARLRGSCKPASRLGPRRRVGTGEGTCRQFSPLCRTARRDPDPGTLDHQEPHADHHAQTQTAEPLGPLRR